ncbi:M20/M25/M40 family metallo-hydrolase [Mycoplasma sp. 1018B]|uniref:M20/M25/M40 family metallo-hydrolase n=1 Tax=Mycoplasma sp. 1018B TaxID=2967302 RepID=UPI00211BE837|nr:M20/M25/M40 family metallo-hydrolase [Mycoplasma sp. 1018B]UUM19386.1 M20/M25/M40 family metallo-hydrolase [Mycoplasma sp. 1018B]
MNKEIFKTKLLEYMKLEAPSRFEKPVAQKLIQNLHNTNFEISYDNFGSLILHKKSHSINAPKIMIAAHMDEVGYLVRDITSTGHILVEPIGGIWPTVVIGTKAILINSLNERFEGVFGHTSIHILEPEKRTKAINNKELYVDFGFFSKENALENKVEIGNVIYLTAPTINFHNQNLIAGKAMDNRAGVCVLEYIAHKVNQLNLDVDLFLVATVQEEVGTRGAKTSVQLINPDIAIALDTTSSHDTPDVIAGTTKLGLGAALRIMDGAMMADPKLTNYLCHIGEKFNIKHYKFISMGGGTDASALQYSKGGAATITISLPQRYLHSPIGVCDINDLIAAGDLLTEFIKNMNLEIYDRIIKYK